MIIEILKTILIYHKIQFNNNYYNYKLKIKVMILIKNRIIKIYKNMKNI
jgi:hypothetical protein